MTNIDRLKEIAEPRSEEAKNRAYWRRFYRQTIRENAKSELIEKACGWLESNLCHYDENYCEIDSGKSLIEDFKKAMEE